MALMLQQKRLCKELMSGNSVLTIAISPLMAAKVRLPTNVTDMRIHSTGQPSVPYTPSTTSQFSSRVLLGECAHIMVNSALPSSS